MTIKCKICGKDYNVEEDFCEDLDLLTSLEYNFGNDLLNTICGDCTYLIGKDMEDAVLQILKKTFNMILIFLRGFCLTQNQQMSSYKLAVN